MAESKQKRRSGKFDVFIKILTGMRLQDLRPYQKLNIVLTIITALVMLLLIVPPVLLLVNSLIISIGNIFVSIFSTRDLLVVPAGASVSEWTYFACLAVLLIEFIVCHRFCFSARNLNSDPPPDGNH